MTTIVLLHTNNLTGAKLEQAREIFIEFEHLFQVLNKEYQIVREKDPLMETLITMDEKARDLAYQQLRALGCTVSYIQF